MIPAKVIFKGQNGITFSLDISVLIPTGVKINNEFVKKKKKTTQQNLSATCEHKHAQSVKKKSFVYQLTESRETKSPGKRDK